jgi:hypothetical protein
MSLKLTTIYLDKEVIKQIKKVAADMEVSMAEFVRLAVNEKLKQCSQEQYEEDRDGKK